MEDSTIKVPEWVAGLLKGFEKMLEPYESKYGDLNVCVFMDERTSAWFCECHVAANKLVQFGTTDVPLDPEEQSEYRANRMIVEDAYAFKVMKDDAIKGRAFSNIVAEYTTEFDSEHPLKIIGGQHRFQAIKDALTVQPTKFHGVKVYLGLTMEQRLDVQLISNTNIATSSDLFDRMQETSKGPQLRDWCQDVGLLGEDQDFADKSGRGGAITVRLARTFILNYIKGSSIEAESFLTSDTTPTICSSGQHDPEWEKIRSPDLWENAGLIGAGKEFARLIASQRAAFVGQNPKPPVDRPEKALNAAILSAWAFVAGALSKNSVRLDRHYSISSTFGKDPLNAVELSKARHKTDPDNYRGLGFRTDAKERGRLVELFYYQAEKGCGITKSSIEVAIAKYYAKQAQLDVNKAELRSH